MPGLGWEREFGRTSVSRFRDGPARAAKAGPIETLKTTATSRCRRTSVKPGLTYSPSRERGRPPQRHRRNVFCYTSSAPTTAHSLLLCPPTLRRRYQSKLSVRL